MKKFIVQLAGGIVTDLLINYAVKQRDHGGTTQTHQDRWNTILSFLVEIKQKGIPV